MFIVSVLAKTNPSWRMMLITSTHIVLTDPLVHRFDIAVVIYMHYLTLAKSQTLLYGFTRREK